MRFIASRSAVIPSLLTLPLTQCHHVRGRADCGGFTKPFSNDEERCAAQPTIKQTIAHNPRRLAKWAPCEDWYYKEEARVGNPRQGKSTGAGGGHHLPY